MGPADKSTLNPSAMDKLATDGSNWLLWQATMKSFFESKNLIKHIEGTAARPLPPPTFAATHTITDGEMLALKELKRGWKSFWLEKDWSSHKSSCQSQNLWH